MSEEEIIEITDYFKNYAKLSYWMGYSFTFPIFICIFFFPINIIWLTTFLPFGILMLNDGRYLSQTRRVIITLDSIQFILPKFFGGLKLFKVCWSNIKQITIKRTHVAESPRYIFSFELPDDTETIRIRTNRDYCEYVVKYEIIDSFDVISQEKGIKINKIDVGFVI